jgi:hypothetical protein
MVVRRLNNAMPDYGLFSRESAPFVSSVCGILREEAREILSFSGPSGALLVVGVVATVWGQ